MLSRELTKADAARMLGVVYQSISAYGKVGASRTTALAIAAIEMGLRPYTPSDEDRRIAANRSPGGPPHDGPKKPP